MFTKVAIAVGLLSYLLGSAAAQGPPVVHLNGGSVAGEMNGSVAVFKGVPFAKPPVGVLRWREPQALAAWAGTLEATKFSHPCMQSLAGTDAFIQPLAEAYGKAYPVQTLDPSEDCLYLNIWTPRLQAGARLPVMVWLHGGSNRVGSGGEDAYDGSSLTARGVIVVTVNYRLGILGFFTHPELTAESARHSSGNYGLLDQIAALRWVQANIAQFGGDAGNVTVFGESAGSIDATTLMTSPLTTGLFRRVIAESGPAFGIGPSRTVAQMEPLGEAVGREAGGKVGAELAVLRSLPAARLAGIEDGLIAAQFKGFDPNAAVVDGWVLSQSPARAFALGKLQPVDLLAGFNAREFSAFRIGAAAAAKKLPPPAQKTGVADQLRLFADTARPLYGGWTDVAVATYAAKILMHGAAGVDQATNDIVAACPIGAEAALNTQTGRRAYVYRFDRTVPGNSPPVKGEAELGAFHSLEIPYVFGTFETRGFRWLPFGDVDRKLSNMMQGYWTNFAKTGDPNGQGLPRWDAWDVDAEPMLVFEVGGEAGLAVHSSPVYCHLAPGRLRGQLGD